MAAAIPSNKFEDVMWWITEECMLRVNGVKAKQPFKTPAKNQNPSKDFDAGKITELVEALSGDKLCFTTIAGKYVVKAEHCWARLCAEPLGETLSLYKTLSRITNRIRGVCFRFKSYGML